jgi:hypothetical protein
MSKTQLNLYARLRLARASKESAGALAVSTFAPAARSVLNIEIVPRQTDDDSPLCAFLVARFFATENKDSPFLAKIKIITCAQAEIVVSHVW